MAKRKILGDYVTNSSKECLVCGDLARGLNFNVMTCVPCKAFFRKNAFKRSNIGCEFDQNCNITKTTRSYCSPCRLKKCFVLGMDPNLIRSIPYSNTVFNKTRHLPRAKNQPIPLPTPLPLSLLRNDRSTLTSYEWTLLSNLLHVFDEQNLRIQIQYSLDRISSLPLKLRFRPSDTYNIIGQFFTGVQSLIDHSPDATSLSFNARRVLTKHNLHSTGAINGIFLCRELDLFNNPFFWDSCNIQYGSEFMIDCVQNAARLNGNGDLIKMMLFVVAFSSNCSIVIFNDQEFITSISSSLDLVRIQNVYVTMLWKYLVYLYGFKEAVIRFSYLVKSITDVIHMLELMPTNETHNLMIETIVTETERALVIKE